MSEDALLPLCSDEILCELINDHLHHKMRYNPLVPLLVYNGNEMGYVKTLFDETANNYTPKATSRLLHAVLLAEMKPVFYKINIHAALTPSQVKDLFNPAIEQAKILEKICKLPSSSSTTDPGKPPLVTVRNHIIV